MDAFRHKTTLWTYSGGAVDATTNFRPIQSNPSCVAICGGDEAGHCPDAVASSDAQSQSLLLRMQGVDVGGDDVSGSAARLRAEKKTEDHSVGDLEQISLGDVGPNLEDIEGAERDDEQWTGGDVEIELSLSRSLLLSLWGIALLSTAAISGGCWWWFAKRGDAQNAAQRFAI